VLMTGAAFLPLDPGYPRHRIGELLASSGAAAVLTTSALAAGLPPFAGPVLLVDRPADPSDQLPPCPTAPVRPDSLAYVIYTSGSTGRPKGVQATHGGLANLTGWLRAAYRLGPGERSTLIASPTFDASVWEIWPALATGGTIVVPPDDVRLAPRDLAQWLAAQRITWTFLPTPLAEAMLDETWPHGTALRYLVTGGDAIRRTTPAGLPFTFVNHYGPTETTVIVTHTPVPPGGPARPPIGRPLGGIRAYVLAGLDRVPVGVPGELCIGGAGVTRGYLGDPAATAAAFVPDPWQPGQRMYRTGDRVRWLADGRLEFLGRTDDQVKIRGFRIEPGEIAATLRQHPEVSDAVVVARPDAADRPRLAGYAVTAASPAALRAFLAERLPSYLVPEHLVPMDALPWTPNGKVDKAALPKPAPPEPGAGGPAEGTPGAPARSETQRRIAVLWQDLLGVGAVGPGDDFFGLGGHSLLVAKMLAQVDDALGCSVPLSVFLAQPTLAGLAAAVDDPGSWVGGGAGAGADCGAAGSSGPPDGIDLDALSDAEAAALLAVLGSDGESP
jgi:amino acid adenylation domain-containing protein